MRHQRRPAGRRQCGDGRARAARHRSCRHAIHGSQAVDIDSKSRKEKLETRNWTTDKESRIMPRGLLRGAALVSFPERSKSNNAVLSLYSDRSLVFYNL